MFMHKKFLFALSFFLVLTVSAQISKSPITTDKAEDELLKKWDSVELAFQELRFEEAFKLLQQFIQLPPIFALPEQRKFSGEKLFEEASFVFEGKEISLRQKALQRLSQLSVEEIEIYQTMYDSVAKVFYQKGLAGDLNAFKMTHERYPFSSYGDDALYYWASYELEQGDLERATVLLERFLQLFRPEITSIRYAQVIAQLAWAKRKLGTLSFELQVQEKLPSLHYFMGEMFLKIGDEAWLPHLRENIQFQGKTQTLERFLNEIFELPVEGPRSEEWPTFMGHFSRNRRMPSIRGIGKKLWKYQENRERNPEFFENDILSFPVFSAGKLIVQLSQEIVCLDVAKGEVLWKTPDPKIRSEKLTDYRGGTIHEGHFYTVSTRSASVANDPNMFLSSLSCISLKSGKMVWKRSNEKEGGQTDRELRLENVRLYGTPILFGDFVICPGVKREQEITTYLHWFDRKTGALLFQKMVVSKIRSENEREGYNPSEDPSMGGIASWGGIIYFVTGVGVVVAYDAETAEPIWLNKYRLGVSPKKESHLFMTQGRAQGTPIVWWFNPPVISQDFVYATPTDTSSLLRYSRTQGTILDLYPTTLKNTRFQYLLGVLPDQTFLMNGPYVFQMANLNYPESPIVGEHPTLEHQILGPGWVTETDVYLPCAKMKNVRVENYVLRRLDLRQEGKLIEDYRGLNKELNLEESCTFTVVQNEKSKYIVCVNGSQIVTFSELE